MRKLKRMLVTTTIFLIVAFTFSSCGLFYGRGWGCGGPHYYDDRRSSD